MSAPKVHKIKTLSSFTSKVERLLAGTRSLSPQVRDAMNWYRGHSASVDYKLLPGLYRHKTITDAKELVELESRMMWAFKRQAMLHGFQEEIVTPVSRASLLFYMQHHGVPTRLLDWSSNPFIALYFALSRAKRDKDGNCTGPAAVWILDPYRWNRFALSELGWKNNEGPADASDQRIKTYLPQPIDASQTVKRYPLPIALVGAVNTHRMLAQKGNFTIFSDDTRPMETIFDKEKFPAGCLVKLEVAAEDVSGILEVLLSVGYTDSVAYPDLEGLAMEIKRLHGFGP